MYCFYSRQKVKISQYQAVEAHTVVGRRGSHIFYAFGEQMAVTLSALRSDSPLPPARFLVLIFFRPSRPQDYNAVIRLCQLV
jgi:hypothetical protein